MTTATQEQTTIAQTANGNGGDHDERIPSFTIAFRFTREQLDTYRIVLVRADDGLPLPSQGELAEVISRHLKKGDRDAYVATEIKTGHARKLEIENVYSHEQVLFLKEEPKKPERKTRESARTPLERVCAQMRNLLKTGLSRPDAFAKAAQQEGWAPEQTKSTWEVVKQMV